MSTPSDALAALAAISLDDFLEARAAISENLGTPSDAPAVPVEFDFLEARAALAANPGTPPGVLAALAEAHYRGVKYNLANNPSTPVEVLARIAGDPDDQLVYQLADNPSLPTGTLLEIGVARRPRLLWDRFAYLTEGGLRLIAAELDAIQADPAAGFSAERAARVAALLASHPHTPRRSSTRSPRPPAPTSAGPPPHRRSSQQRL